MRRTVGVLAALVLIIAACGGDADSEAEATTAATTATTSAPTVTVAVPESMTTSSEAEATTTTVEAATTTAPLTSDPRVVLAEEKVASIEAAMPVDYSFTTAVDDDAEEDNSIFTSCLSPGSFDLDQLDDVSVIAYDIDFDTPDVGVFGAASGSLEVRVFEDDGVAAAAFATLEELLGTDEGRLCVADQLGTAMATEIGDDSELSVSVEPGPLLGDAASRIILDMTVAGFEATVYFDLVASREGDCTVYGVFQAFDEPFDETAANDLLFSAFGG